MFLFSLKARQSNIYDGDFCKESSTIDFWLGSNTALGNSVKESSHLKHFPSSAKLFVSLFLSQIFISSQKSENVLQKEIEPLKPVYWLKKPVLDPP